MTFLEMIGGLKYEGQTSAILQYLFVNSDTFRRAFIDKISGEFTSSLVPQFTNGIFCHREVSDGDNGRIDLLVEADNCFLAIENKIWAGFQDGQPSRYGKIVEKRCQRDLKTEYRIVLIVPSQLRDKVERITGDQEFEQPLIVMHWQDIQFHMLKPVREHDSPRVRVIAELLDEFIEQQIGKFADLNFPEDRLIGNQARITNQYQRDFLYAIKSSFADFDLSRMGFGKETHGGFYFYVKEASPKNWNWFGFHCSPQGTVLQFQLNLVRAPNVQFTAWELSDQNNREGGYDFNFVTQKHEWPTNRVDWDDRIHEILGVVKECATDRTKVSELST